MYDADMSKALVTKAVKAVKPGGRIVIHGFCTNEEQTGPLNDTLFSLNIGMWKWAIVYSASNYPSRLKKLWLRVCLVLRTVNHQHDSGDGHHSAPIA